MPVNKFEVESIFTGVDRLSKPLGKMGRSVNQFQSRASKSLGSARQSFNSVGAAATGAVAAIGAMGVAAGAVLINAGKVGADFEQSITNAAAKFPGQIRRGTDAFRELEEAAKKTGRSTEFTASQSAETNPRCWIMRQSVWRLGRLCPDCCWFGRTLPSDMVAVAVSVRLLTNSS